MKRIPKIERWQMQQRMALPLEAKINFSLDRIRQWYEYYDGNVYVSFSGGKDSTVLLHLVRSLYPDVEAVFCDTGLEFPEVRDFAYIIGATPLKPKMNFRQVIDKYGYPVISKEQAAFIEEFRNTKSPKLMKTRLEGNKWGRGKISKKHRYLIDAPFKISDKCCDIMKKNPAKEFEKETGKHPYIGTTVGESDQRMSNYLMYGCNAFEKRRPTSQPISIWTGKDIARYLTIYHDEMLQYIKGIMKIRGYSEDEINARKHPWASVYGEIITTKNLGYQFTGEPRTGCVFCMFGCHLEKEPNKFQRLEKTHPQLHKYCIEQMGCGKVLDYIGVDYSMKKIFLTTCAQCEKRIAVLVEPDKRTHGAYTCNSCVPEWSKARNGIEEAIETDLFDTNGIA